MRYAIRLLALGMLSLFVAAVWVGDVGEHAVATEHAQHTQHYAGLLEFFVLWALLALTLLLFVVVSAFGIALALRQRDRPWGIAFALIVLGIGALYLGTLVPPGVLLPLVVHVLPASGFRALPLALLPALLGSAVMAAYSFRTPPTLHPVPYQRQAEH